jgi:hypothetical protein
VNSIIFRLSASPSKLLGKSKAKAKAFAQQLDIEGKAQVEIAEL